MTLGSDVPFGPRHRRERLFDINNLAGWVGFDDPHVTASTDDMKDDQDRRLPPEISMSIPSERRARASASVSAGVGAFCRCCSRGQFGAGLLT